MDESRRLAMRRAHARRAYHCTCGKTVHGNGGYKMHGAMHKRRNDGHYYMTASAYERSRALPAPPVIAEPGPIVAEKGTA